MFFFAIIHLFNEKISKAETPRLKKKDPFLHDRKLALVVQDAPAAIQMPNCHFQHSPADVDPLQ